MALTSLGRGKVQACDFFFPPLVERLRENYVGRRNIDVGDLWVVLSFISVFTMS